jgi:hypothetical protein
MNWIKALFADLSTGFSVHDIPVILVQCFTALCMAFVLKKIYVQRNTESRVAWYFLPLSVMAVLVGIISKTGLQGSVIGMGFLLLFGGFFSSESTSTKFFLVAVALFSVLCGFAQVPLAVLVFIIFLLFIFFKPNS